MNIESRIEIMSASERSSELLQTGKLKIFGNLKKSELCDELHQRGVRFFTTQNKPDLKKKLEKEVKGIQNAPALLIPNINNVNLIKSYEILAVEPMHDILGHWKNLIEEIPHHLK